MIMPFLDRKHSAYSLEDIVLVLHQWEVIKRISKKCFPHHPESSREWSLMELTFSDRIMKNFVRRTTSGHKMFRYALSDDELPQAILDAKQNNPVLLDRYFYIDENGIYHFRGKLKRWVLWKICIIRTFIQSIKHLVVDIKAFFKSI